MTDFRGFAVTDLVFVFSLTVGKRTSNVSTFSRSERVEDKDQSGHRLLLVVRTVLVDKTLRNESSGYEEYGERVRYRLIPGVW